MQAALIVYFITSLDAWHAGLSLIMAFTGMGALLVIVFYYGMVHDGTKRVPKGLIIWPLVVVLITGLINILLPTKDDAKYIAAAYGVQYVVQSKTGQQVLDKSGKIVNNVLDLAIAKTSATPTGERK